MTKRCTAPMPLATSAILAAAIRKAEPDLVICGMASTDGSMGVLPSMIAERLGWPAATWPRRWRFGDRTVTIRRDGDLASLTVEADLPAVVSVTDQSGEARYPSMKGILAAKKKPVESWTLADLGVDPGSVGLAAAWSRVVSGRPPAAQGGGAGGHGRGRGRDGGAGGLPGRRQVHLSGYEERRGRYV